MNLLKSCASTGAPASVLLIRVMVGVVFLLIVGAGAWSLDARLGPKGETNREEKNTK